MWPVSFFLPSVMYRRPEVVAAIRAAAGAVEQAFVLDQHANAAWSGQRARASRTGLHTTLILTLNHSGELCTLRVHNHQGNVAWLSL